MISLIVYIFLTQIQFHSAKTHNIQRLSFRISFEQYIINQISIKSFDYIGLITLNQKCIRKVWMIKWKNAIKVYRFIKLDAFAIIFFYVSFVVKSYHCHLCLICDNLNCSSGFISLNSFCNILPILCSFRLLMKNTSEPVNKYICRKFVRSDLSANLQERSLIFTLVNFSNILQMLVVESVQNVTNYHIHISTIPVNKIIFISH